MSGGAEMKSQQSTSNGKVGQADDSGCYGQNKRENLRRDSFFKNKLPRKVSTI